MKKKITFQNIIFLVLAIIIAYRFTFLFAEKGENILQATFTEDNDGFLNYVLLRPWSDTLPYWHITNHFESFRELNYNGSQHYGGDGQYLGYFHQDSLNGIQRDTLSRIHNLSNQNGLRCFLERQRISWLCYSQRLIYEAEGGNYGFSYQRRSANIIQDSNRMVIHACANELECPETDATPRMLCDSIYENLQHTDLYYFHPDSSDIKPWILKPKMRIKQSDFSDTNTTPVVAIITKNYLGATIDSVIIRVFNFSQSGVPNNYFGQYVNNFFDLNLSVSGRGDTIAGLNYGKPAPGEDIKQCKVDFKVYWFGLVDVWFDKMIVDDTRADQLFGEDYAGNYDCKIKDYSNLENYLYALFLVKEKKYTTANILPINYVMKIMYDELARKNILPDELAAR